MRRFKLSKLLSRSLIACMIYQELRAKNREQYRRNEEPYLGSEERGGERGPVPVPRPFLFFLAYGFLSFLSVFTSLCVCFVSVVFLSKCPKLRTCQKIQSIGEIYIHVMHRHVHV